VDSSGFQRRDEATNPHVLVAHLLTGPAPEPLQAVERSEILQKYSKLPLSFEPNTSVIDRQVKFLARSRDYDVFLTPTEVILAVRASNVVANKNAANATVSALNPSPEQSIRAEHIHLKLVGANPRASIRGEGELQSKSNYFIGNNPTQWRRNVRNFASVKYEDVYPGVDLTFYGDTGQRFETDFIVKPNADLKAIQMHLGGNRKLSINAAGDLEIQVRLGMILLKKPVAYQLQNGRRNVVSARYTIAGKNSVGIETAQYDRSSTLIIDPVLSYSTYIGGTSADVATSVAVDSAGDLYITGNTSSTDFPSTPGSFDAAFPVPAGTAAFIAKLASDGKSLVYSTFLGGSTGQFNFSSNISSAAAVKIDNVGNAYVVGDTDVSDFPTVNAFQSSCKQCYSGTGSYDLFISKIDPTGSALLYSSYFGGTSPDFSHDLAVDNAGSAVLTGSTRSADFPVTQGAFDTVCGTDGKCNLDSFSQPLYDGFVAKFDTTKGGVASLIYSSFLGGSNSDQAGGIAIDSTGSAYVVGTTNSSDFPVTQGALQSSLCISPQGGCVPSRIFITKINPNGTSVIYSTYLGGSGADNGLAIALDSNGNAYVTGWTLSTDFPVTQGAFFQTVPPSGINTFVSKLNSTGTGLLYSTYLGGSNFDEGDAIAVDAAGEAYVAGRTGSIDFPIVSVVQTEYGGGYSDVFLTKLNSTGSQLLFSTYLGGSSDDGSFSSAFTKIGIGLAVGPTGDAYVVSATQSPDYPTTLGVFQATLAGTVDATITHISGLPVSGAAARALRLTSINPASGVALIASPVDNNGLSSGVTPFTLAYIDGTAVIVNAPPIAQGNRFSNWTGCDSGSGTSCTINLNADRVVTANYMTPLIPMVSLSNSYLNFANQALKTTSEPQSVIVTNIGNSALGITAVPTISGNSASDFAVASGTSCTNGATVAPAAFCTLNITFTPSALGARGPATLSITDSASNSPQTVMLSGTGVTPVWRKLTGTWSGSCDGSFGAIAIHPSNPNVIYLGNSHPTLACGLYKSNDGGQSWSAVDNGFPLIGVFHDHYAPVTKIAIAPDNTRILYVGTAKQNLLGFDGAVFRSGNGGASWIDVSGRGLAIFRTRINSGVLDVAVDPRNSFTVFVGQIGTGVSKTTNAGITWVNAKRGISIPGVQVGFYYTIRIAPSRPQVIYGAGFLDLNAQILPCVTSNGGGGGGCLHLGGNAPLVPFRSMDGGKTWTSMNFPAASAIGNAMISDLAVDPLDQNALYAATIAYATTIAGFPLNVPNMGVFKSSNGGIDWQPVNDASGVDLAQFPIFKIVIDPSSPTTLYAVAGSSGIFRTTNGGATWGKLSISGIPNGIFIGNIAVAGQRVYALTSNGVYVSSSLH
jgi:photosystem II stability/assembly factor-like uncharacterized protein